jgi:hypothetical protein
MDESTYPAGNPNSLMTFALGQAEAIHNPGPLVLGMLEDSGWATGCAFSLVPAGATFSAAGGNGSVTVVGGASCAWMGTSDSSFLTITGGFSGIGSGTVTYSVDANASSAARTGTLTIAGVSFTVSQAGFATMAVDHTLLSFGATNAGGILISTTASQRVAVTFTGVTTGTWTAAGNRPWLGITGGSGMGNGEFTVAVVSDPSLPATGTVTGSVTVASSVATNSPVVVSVTLTLVAPGATQGPFGAFDTPLDGTTGAQGSIAVTGWALDDVEVDRVEIWRDLMSGETTVPYFDPGHPGHGKVFIANAFFVAGSRPDVEAAFPGSPLAYRSGWGYLLLTWGLWEQGNGTYRLYAFAFDKEGHAATLGVKTIAVDNAHANKPFGSIDTPAYGQTVSGSFWNYGWALTPGPDCAIANGNVWMAIDSGPLIPVSYGDLRADIAASFPGFSNGSGAGGAFNIDTTILTNGPHTIGWLVTDGCGRTDGIGSRFFTVFNGAALTGQ